jgi:hypothetical protein
MASTGVATIFIPASTTRSPTGALLRSGPADDPDIKTAESDLKVTHKFAGHLKSPCSLKELINSGSLHPSSRDMAAFHGIMTCSLWVCSDCWKALRHYFEEIMCHRTIWSSSARAPGMQARA